MTSSGVRHAAAGGSYLDPFRLERDRRETTSESILAAEIVTYW